MASTTVVKVKVQELTKYGFKANERFVNYSKQISEADKAKVVPGAEFEAEYYVADSGKEYLNKVLHSSPESVPTTEAMAHTGLKPATSDTERAKKFTPKFQKKDSPSATMSKEEWQAKDRSQLIGGLSHDAAAITAAFVAVTGETEGAAILTSYKFILEGMLKIREEVK